jgi:hypothetical protein
MVRIKLEISFWGDLLDPIELSKVLDIQPTDYWHKGDSLPSLEGKAWKKPNKPVRKENAWEYATEYIETYDLEDIVESLLDKFEPFTDIISNYIKTKKLETKLDVIAECVSGESTTALYINKRLINFISKINGVIDIDLYISESE